MATDLLGVLRRISEYNDGQQKYIRGALVHALTLGPFFQIISLAGGVSDGTVSAEEKKSAVVQFIEGTHKYQSQIMAIIDEKFPHTTLTDVGALEILLARFAGWEIEVGHIAIGGAAAAIPEISDDTSERDEAARQVISLFEGIIDEEVFRTELNRVFVDIVKRRSEARADAEALSPGLRDLTAMMAEPDGQLFKDNTELNMGKNADTSGLTGEAEIFRHKGGNSSGKGQLGDGGASIKGEIFKGNGGRGGKE